MNSDESTLRHRAKEIGCPWYKNLPSVAMRAGMAMNILVKAILSGARRPAFVPIQVLEGRASLGAFQCTMQDPYGIGQRGCSGPSASGVAMTPH